MSKAPITYIEKFLLNHEDVYTHLWNELPWERRPDAPRRECWMNDFAVPYTYGTAPYERTYNPNPWDVRAQVIRASIRELCGEHLAGCFVNGYEGPRDHLGWHADDSPLIDNNKPIAVVSLGSARNIWFRENGSSDHEALLLAPGSLLLMHAGMQMTHQHRIPKHSAQCGNRISLTYRGLVVPE